jgi:hypothetical protein
MSPEEAQAIVENHLPEITWGISKTSLIHAREQYLPEAPDLVLGEVACGFTSQAVQHFLEASGVANQRILNVHSSFLEMIGGHVINCVSAESESEICLDANYRQMFAAVGMDGFFARAYYRAHGQSIYPTEAVIAYKADQLDELAEWLATVATFMVRRYQHTPEFIERWRRNIKLADHVWEFDSQQELAELFRSIYDPANFRPFEVPEHQLEQFADWLKELDERQAKAGF